MATEMISPAAIEINGEPAAVYRLYDADDSLLYVGVTRDIPVRFAQHETDKLWWQQVVRKTMTWYGSRKEAEAAETTAINSEDPIYNIRRRRKTRLPFHNKPGRKPGRPKVGTQTCFTVASYDLTVIDEIARRESVPRSALLRGIIGAYVASQRTGEPQ